jgi:hypothetical protein
MTPLPAIFLTALSLRATLGLLAITHMAPDSKLFLALSEHFDYSHSVGYPMEAY